MHTAKKKKALFINIAFVITLIGILLFLSKAPEITTQSLPHDDDHNRFFAMNKKVAEKLCVECHTPEDVHEIHKDSTPNTNRCLFCHRRD
ncbi:MAG TPA: hypothetical protein EYH36_00035 [Desulfocapsa sulfexigens]|nr:hypothetical protein [Desulfocapsa sulfexigens]HIQ36380.1 hypothetical protein [Desulfocapsa sulfexigens]